MFESVLHPTAATVIADVVPAETLRKHFGLTRMMSNAGRVFGPAIGAALALWSLALVFLGLVVSLLFGSITVALFCAKPGRQARSPRTMTTKTSRR